MIDELNKLDEELNKAFDEIDDQLNQAFDPMDDLDDQFNSKIHLHIEKRNARKSITTIDGLDNYKLSHKKILKDLKKILSCNGNIKSKEGGGKIIRVQGDHRDEISKFFQKILHLKKEDIIIHGA